MLRCSLRKSFWFPEMSLDIALKKKNNEGFFFLLTSAFLGSIVLELERGCPRAGLPPDPRRRAWWTWTGGRAFAEPAQGLELEPRLPHIVTRPRHGPGPHAVLCLLQDEPSSGMDPCSKRHLWDAVMKEVQEGCAVVLSSHR